MPGGKSVPGLHLSPLLRLVWGACPVPARISSAPSPAAHAAHAARVHLQLSDEFGRAIELDKMRMDLASNASLVWAAGVAQWFCQNHFSL